MRSMISFVAAISFFSLTACAFDPHSESTGSSEDALTAGRPMTGEKVFELAPSHELAFERPSSGEKIAAEVPSRELVVGRPALDKNVFELRPRCSEVRCDDAPTQAMPIDVRK